MITPRERGQTFLLLRLLSISNRAKNHIVRHSAAQLAASYCEREHQPHFASQYLFIAASYGANTPAHSFPAGRVPVSLHA
ncbi:Uncharacterised protein [Klebsiella pneumoniae]|uniref:Uncharacterized protein n=1 Tax=Klebsiella pneumoniae TaxID=573 RepID=A0A2X3D837_KLEPN|nr:Uncharacterised protein [Klebsiella pneumoniae]